MDNSRKRGNGNGSDKNRQKDKNKETDLLCFAFQNWQRQTNNFCINEMLLRLLWLVYCWIVVRQKWTWFHFSIFDTDSFRKETIINCVKMIYRLSISWWIKRTGFMYNLDSWRMTFFCRLCNFLTFSNLTVKWKDEYFMISIPITFSHCNSKELSEKQKGMIRANVPYHIYHQ